MTNFPSGNSLGSVYAELGYDYDPAGMRAFVRDAAAGKAAQAAMRAELRAAGVSARQTAAAFRTYSQVQTAGIRTQERINKLQLEQRLVMQTSRQQITTLRNELSTLTAGTLKYEQTLLRLRQTQARQAEEARRSNLSALGVARGLRTAQAGLGAVGVGLGASEIANFAKEGVGLRIELDQTRRTLGAFLQDVGRGDRIFEQASKFGREYAFTQRQVGEALNASMQVFRLTAEPTEKVLEVMGRLAALNPAEGLEGASYAIREIASGDVQSLADRFNISRQAAIRWRNEIVAGGDAVSVLSKGLDSLGITQALIEERTKGASGEIRKFQQTLEDFQLQAASSIQEQGQPILAFFTELLKKLTEIDRILLAQENRGKTPIEVFGGQVANSLTTRAQNANANILETLAGPNSILQYDPTGILAAIAQTTAEAQRQQVILEENARLAQNARTGRVPTIDEQRQSGEAFRKGVLQEQDAIRTRAQQNEERIAKNREVNQAALQELIVRSEESITKAHEQQNASILANEEQYAENMKRINEQTAEALAQLDKQIGEAREEYQRRRQEQLDETARQVQEFQESIAKRDRREREDRAREQAQEAEDLARSRAREDEDLARRHKEQQDKLHEDEKKEEQEQQEDLARIRQQAQANQLQSTSNFISQLFNLTRRRSTRGRRQAARDEQAAAIEEARQLAETDPEAAAALLAERQRQILEKIQVEEEERQLRRDSRRGGDYGLQDAEEEIRLEREAREAANQAAIDLIKAGSKQKKDQRDEDKADRQKDLDDQQQEERDALARQRAQEDEDRALRNARDEEERRIAKERRDADDAEQLQDIRNRGKEQLDELDRSFNERMQQFEQQRKELEDARTKQLDDAKAAYDQNMKEINDAYAKFLEEQKKIIREAMANMDLSVEEQKAQETIDAWARLGQLAGEAFARELAGAANINGPVQQTPSGYIPTPGSSQSAGDTQGTTGGTAQGKTYSRRGTVQPGDVKLSDQAIDQIVFGARQTDSFSASRGGKGRGSHHGQDLATPLNSPVKTPHAGSVIRVATDKVGGKFVMIRGNKGYTLYFGHLSKQGVKEGQFVQAGQEIGRSGQTPIAPDSYPAGKQNGLTLYEGPSQIGPHVHFQAERNNDVGNGHFVDLSAELEAQVGTGNNATGSGAESVEGPIVQTQRAKGEYTILPVPGSRKPIPTDEVRLIGPVDGYTPISGTKGDGSTYGIPRRIGEPLVAPDVFKGTTPGNLLDKFPMPLPVLISNLPMFGQINIPVTITGVAGTAAELQGLGSRVGAEAVAVLIQSLRRQTGDVGTRGELR